MEIFHLSFDIFHLPFKPRSNRRRPAVLNGKWQMKNDKWKILVSAHLAAAFHQQDQSVRFDPAGQPFGHVLTYLDT
jgi:hypothetical protein